MSFCGGSGLRARGLEGARAKRGESECECEVPFCGESGLLSERRNQTRSASAKEKCPSAAKAGCSASATKDCPSTAEAGCFARGLSSGVARVLTLTLRAGTPSTSTRSRAATSRTTTAPRRRSARRRGTSCRTVRRFGSPPAPPPPPLTRARARHVPREGRARRQVREVSEREASAKRAREEESEGLGA